MSNDVCIDFVCVADYDANCGQVCDCAGQRMARSCCIPDGFQPFPVAPSDSCLADGEADAGTEASTDGMSDSTGQ